MISFKWHESKQKNQNKRSIACQTSAALHGCQTSTALHACQTSMCSAFQSCQNSITRGRCPNASMTHVFKMYINNKMSKLNNQLVVKLEKKIKCVGFFISESVTYN